jgi:hypothetical protein
MSTQDNIFEGFEAMAGSLSPTVNVGSGANLSGDPELDSDDLGDDGTTIIDPDDDAVDPSVITGDSDDDDIDGQDDNADDADGDNDDDDSGNSDDASGDDGQLNGEPTVDTSDLGQYEADITAYFQEQLFDKLGWEPGEDEKFKSVEDLVDYMQKVVEENSQPAYASEDIQKLDEFVKNGGDLREYYEVTKSGINPDTVDLTDEITQKQVIKEHLTNQGYSDTRIDKMLQRYEDAGVLEEEASDAVELIKEYNEKQEQKLLADQDKLAKDSEKRQQEFISTVQSDIRSLSDVRGIKITDDDKKKLINYVLKVGNDGMTQYQKDYQQNFTKNFLESAYLTMKGDAAFKTVEKKAATKAAQTLKQKLSQKGRRVKGSDGSAGRSKSSDLSILSSATKLLRKP